MMICQTRCLQYAQLVNIAISSCLVSPIPIFAVHTIDYNHPHQWKIIKMKHEISTLVAMFIIFSSKLTHIISYPRGPWLDIHGLFSFLFSANPWSIHGPSMVHSKHRCNFAMVASILASCFACSPISSTSCMDRILMIPAIRRRVRLGERRRWLI